MSSTAFVIPEELHNAAPCLTTPELFLSPALDIDEDEWVALTSDAQQTQLEAKTVAEMVAVAACEMCPALKACQKWAVTEGRNLFGVVGGLTETERPATRPETSELDSQDRGPRGQVRDDLIVRWSALGVVNAEIANRLNCDIRTVEKRRAGLLSGRTVIFDPNVSYPARAPRTFNSVPRKLGTATQRASSAPAVTMLVAARISSETAAIFNTLIDGSFHNRDDLINDLLPDLRRDDHNDATARRFLLNRLDIAARRGRVEVSTDTAGEVQVRLVPTVLETWRAHQELQRAA